MVVEGLQHVCVCVCVWWVPRLRENHRTVCEPFPSVISNARYCIIKLQSFPLISNYSVSRIYYSYQCFYDYYMSIIFLIQDTHVPRLPIIMIIARNMSYKFLCSDPSIIFLIDLPLHVYFILSSSQFCLYTSS